MCAVTLRGDTVEIREIEAADVDAIARIIGAPDVLRYTKWRGPADERAAARFVDTALATAAAVPRIEYVMAIVDLQSGHIAGSGGIRIEDADAGVGSLRVLLHPDWWNRGIGTEAAQMAVAFAFDRLHLRRIEADPTVENAAATYLLEKAGLARSEVRPGQHLSADGERRDAVTFFVTREDWAARR